MLRNSRVQKSVHSCEKHHHHNGGSSHCECACDHGHGQQQTQAQPGAHTQHTQKKKSDDGGGDGDEPPHLCACDHMHDSALRPNIQLDVDCDCGHDHGNHTHSHGLTSLIVGAVVFLCSFALQTFAHPGYAVAAQLLAYVVLGWNPIQEALKNCVSGKWFDENFLMTIATIGAIAIGDTAEAAAVMLFYRVGTAFQDRAISNSLRSINALLELSPETAILLEGDTQREVQASSLEIGDQIVVRPGDRVPSDCRIVFGNSSLDKSALTGESIPEAVGVGDVMLSGAVNIEWALTAEVLAPANRSAAAKVLTLVEQASKQKAPTEQFITKFSRLYTPVVCALALLTALVSVYAFDRSWMEALRAACVFLVVSCPCALVLSVPLGFFAGLGLASKHGILVKGGNYLEALGEVKRVAIDKTGTLTTGKLTVSRVEPHGVTEDELVRYAAAAERSSAHPIALAIAAYAGNNTAQGEQITEHPGRGVTCVVEGSTILCGNARLLEENEVQVPESSRGAAIHLSRDGLYIGSIYASDTIRPDAAQTVAALKERGVSATVLSGDREAAVKASAGEAGIDDFYAELLPWQKVEKLQSMVDDAPRGERVACVGDGINDAPMLAIADVGISMGMGSDAAIEASDIVLMEEKLGGLAKAFRVSYATRAVVRQNIIMTLSVKSVVMILAIAGYSNMWAAVSADVGVAVAAILNSARLLKTKM